MPKNIIILRPSPEVGLEKPPKGNFFSELQWERLDEALEGTAMEQSSWREWAGGQLGREPLRHGCVPWLCRATALASGLKPVVAATVQPAWRLGLFCQVVAA